MAMNYQAFIRLAAKVTGVGDVGKLEKSLVKTEKAAKASAQAFKDMAKSKVFKVAAVGAAALSTAIGLSIKAAVDFESKMAEVLKVMDDMDTRGIKDLKREILDLGKVLPIAHKGIADIYAAAGQAGIPREEMRAFALDVGRVAVAFDITAEEAGQAMAKMRTALGFTQDRTRELFDAMNHLGNTVAASSQDIVEFMKRAMGAGKAAGFTAEQTAAFGAAMISAGTETRVAATSFRNFATALTKGESMTNKQIGALSRLGLVHIDAAESERHLTFEVERQSQARVDAARRETDEISKEISRRYRDQMTALQDFRSDRFSETEEGIRDRADAQVKGLQREMNREIKAARERASVNGKSVDSVINQIRDHYDSRIDLVRDNVRDELKIRRRAERDEMTRLRDEMEDQKELEINALKAKLQERERIIKEDKARALDAAKETAKGLAALAGKQLAEQMQTDAMATVRKVFEAIRDLPKPEQLSVLTDLGGEQAARGLVNLVNNAELLNTTLDAVADKNNYVGSTAEEFAKKLNTTAAQFQLLRNETSAMSIVFGEAFLPAVQAVFKALTPVFEGITWALANIPGLNVAVGALAVAFIGLTAAAPVIAGIVAGLAVLKLGLFAGAGAIALFAGKFVLITAAIGLVVKAFIDLGGLLVKLGEQLGRWIWDSREKFQQFGTALSEVWNRASQFFHQNFLTPMGEGINNLVRWVGEAGQQLWENLTRPFKGIGSYVESIYNNITTSIRNRMTSLFNWAVGLYNQAVSMINRARAMFSRSRSTKSKGGRRTRSAAGGVFYKGTEVYLGEGGAPEYVIPSGKAHGFAQNYLAGFRGASAIPRFAEGGYVGPSTANVSIQTGPVTQMHGTNFITTSDMQRAVQSGVQQTLTLLRSDMNVRRRVGLA